MGLRGFFDLDKRLAALSDKGWSVMRYDPQAPVSTFAPAFDLVESRRHDHSTQRQYAAIPVHSISAKF